MMEINIFNKNSPKNPHNTMCQILMDKWKLISTWQCHGSCKLVALGLQNNCSYIVVIGVAQLAYIYNFIYCEIHLLQFTSQTYKIS